MAITYYRRFRMEIDVRHTALVEARLPGGYDWVEWNASLLDRHAAVKFESFRSEIDSLVFSCLGETDGCQRLMHQITQQQAFLPESTWLITTPSGGDVDPVDCATIQGLVQSRNVGAVQNVGVVPEYRGQGLGRALVLKALHGFRLAGLRRVCLEVTADNTPAVRLYRSLGFRLIRTMYKAVEAQPSAGYAVHH